MLKKKRRKSRSVQEENVIDFEQAREIRKKRRQEAVEKRTSKKSKEVLSERKQNKRNKKRMIYLCIFAGIILIMGVSLYNVAKLHNEYKEIMEENKALEKEKVQLTEELNNVNDPEYIEQQARKQLKMVKPGEIMYILPQNSELASGSGIQSDSQAQE